MFQSRIDRKWKATPISYKDWILTFRFDLEKQHKLRSLRESSHSLTSPPLLAPPWPTHQLTHCFNRRQEGSRKIWNRKEKPGEEEGQLSSTNPHTTLLRAAVQEQRKHICHVELEYQLFKLLFKKLIPWFKIIKNRKSLFSLCPKSCFAKLSLAPTADVYSVI